MGMWVAVLVITSVLLLPLGGSESAMAEGPGRLTSASLAAGDSAGDILKDFPALRPEDIQSAIAFAAASAAEDLPVPEAPQIR